MFLFLLALVTLFLFLYFCRLLESLFRFHLYLVIMFLSISLCILFTVVALAITICICDLLQCTVANILSLKWNVKTSLSFGAFYLPALLNAIVLSIKFCFNYEIWFIKLIKGKHSVLLLLLCLLYCFFLFPDASGFFF